MRHRNGLLRDSLAIFLSLLIFAGLIYSFAFYRLSSKEKSSHELYEDALKYTFFIISEDSKGAFENKSKSDNTETGSGFVIKNAGEYYLITANHVVSKKKNLFYVSFSNEKKIYKVKKLGWDLKFDLAVLKFDEDIKWPHPAVLGKGLERVGDKVYVSGNPLGLRFFWLNGHLIETKAYVPGLTIGFLATNAACNPGNSGGPVINSWGEIIGVVDSVTKSANPICLAIPVEVLNKLLFPLSAGEVEHGSMGVEIVNSWQLTPGMKKKMGLEKIKEDGVIVVKVMRDSSAYGKLQKGDLLLSYGPNPENANIPIKDTNRFIEELNLSYFLGDEIAVKFRRGKEYLVKKIRLVSPPIFEKS